MASQKEIRYVLLGSTVTVWERVPSLPTGPGEACLLPEWGAMPETVPVTDVYVVVPPWVQLENDPVSNPGFKIRLLVPVVQSA